MMRTTLFSRALLASSLLVLPAYAENPAAEADRLFGEAKELAEAGRYADACPKLERSLELDPAIGTEFNLADCHEHLGRLASAWRHYRNVEKGAHVAGKSEREAAAHARLGVLKPKLGWLRVEPAPGSAVAALMVDGEAVALLSATDSPDGLPLDAGARKLAAKSTAQDDWSQTVTAAAGAHLTVHPFQDAMAKKNAAPAAAVEPKRGGTQRALAATVGLVGVAGLVVGGASGIASMVNNSSAKDAGCPEPSAGCTGPRANEAVDSWSRATTFGTVSTVGFVVGGVAVATAIVLWVTAPKSHGTPTTARVDVQGLHF